MDEIHESVASGKFCLTHREVCVACCSVQDRAVMNTQFITARGPSPKPEHHLVASSTISVTGGASPCQSVLLNAVYANELSTSHMTLGVFTAVTLRKPT